MHTRAMCTSDGVYCYKEGPFLYEIRSRGRYFWGALKFYDTGSAKKILQT